jgi:hypothetical protein
MKKKAIISGIGLVFCGLLSAQAQERVAQPATNPDEAKILSKNQGDVTIDYDIKLYSGKEEAMSAEQASNPAKPVTPESDTKPDTEGISVKDNIPAPSRPATADTDPKLNNGTDLNQSFEKIPEVISSQSVNTSTDIDANTGLEKVKTEGAILNYREINGPPSQEIPDPQGKIINYRELKGPDDQPREKQPAR